MKTYKARYQSPNDLFTGAINIKASNRKEAMLKFLSWVQTKDFSEHLRGFDVWIEEMNEIETI